MNHLKLNLIWSGLLLSCLSMHGSILVPGNSVSSDQTVDFAIGTHAFDKNGGTLKRPTMYIGAAAAVSGNPYAVARANPSTKKLEALAPEQISLNGADSTNPLYGAKIDFLKLNDDRPVVFRNGDLTPYKYSTINDALRLVSSDPVADANGNAASEIIAVEVANGSVGQTFVACNVNGGTSFGESGSGIALYEYITGSSGTSNFIFQNDKKACALDNSSATIKIGNNVTLANAVTLYWCNELGRLFVGLQAQASSNAGDGARSIVVGKIQPVTDQGYDQIIFEEFAPESAFSGNNQIVGTATADAAVSALQINSLVTSTGLNYLIVVGGNGAATSVGNQVYALPLVSGTSNRGHLAKYDQTPTDKFVGTTYMGRTLQTAATDPSDTLSNSSSAAIVGGGTLPLNANENISELFTSNDTVYAAIGTTSVKGATGLYYSQAIFNTQGLIQSWTPWQKAAGFTGAWFGAGLDQYHGQYWQLLGSDSSSVNTIKYTTWNANQDGLFAGTTSDAAKGLVAYLNGQFPNSVGGIFGLNTVSELDPALDQISLLIATGFKKVVIANPSAAVAGDFTTKSTESTNNAFPSTSPTTTLVTITGSQLTNLGAITTSHIATDGSGMSWLLIGGVGGMAVLRQSDGTGWSSPLTSLGDLSSNFEFKSLGDYSFVRAITSDTSYLYVLTNNKLDRIPLTASNLASSSLSTTTIANVGEVVQTDVNDCWFDILVSGDLALLAGSAGLYRINNGGSIQNSAIYWTPVTIPDQRSAPCTKLIAISPTGLSADLVQGGNLYVITSYRGLQQTQVNRFYVNLSGTIDDNTIQALPDLYIKNTQSGLINFESFRDLFYTDGSFWMTALSKDCLQNSNVSLLPSGLQSGTSPIYLRDSYTVPFETSQTVASVSALLRDAYAGTMLVAGDFGLQVNE